MRHSLFGLIAFGSLLGSSACDACKGNGPDVSVPKSDAAAPVGLSAEQASQVVATVGQRKITVGDVASALEAMDQFDRLRYQAKERRKELLNEMINVELLAQEAIEKGYDKDPMTQEELRIIARDAVLAEIRKSGPMPADIPEADVRAYYDAHPADFKDPERRRISVLLAKDEVAAKSALGRAQKGLQAVEWGELVKEKSVDPQVRAMPVDLAGDMGIVAPPGSKEVTKVPDEVRVAAFRIEKVGGVHPEVVRTKDQFYVVRLTQVLEPRTRTLAEAERVIRVKLSEERISAKEDAIVNALKKRYPVEVNEAALAKVQSNWAKDAGAPAPHAP